MMKQPSGFICASCSRTCFDLTLAPVCHRCRQREESERRALWRGIWRGFLLFIVPAITLYIALSYFLE